MRRQLLLLDGVLQLRYLSLLDGSRDPEPRLLLLLRLAALRTLILEGICGLKTYSKIPRCPIGKPRWSIGFFAYLDF